MRKKIFYIKSPYNIYCEHIIPDKKRFAHPIVMIHGVAHTGSCYKTKPDNDAGWAYYLASRGYEVYLPDWPGMGSTNDIDHLKDEKLKIVDFFKAKGVKAELLWLGDSNIIGNGHMMMLEKNSDSIAELIYQKIK